MEKRREPLGNRWGGRILQYKSAELRNVTMKTMADVQFLNNRRGVTGSRRKEEDSNAMKRRRPSRQRIRDMSVQGDDQDQRVPP
jgi:hypothetical protein